MYLADCYCCARLRRKMARQADQIGASHTLYNCIVVVCNLYSIVVICDEREYSSMLAMPNTVISYRVLLQYY